MNQRINVEANTLPGLLEALREQFCVTLDSVFIGGDADQEIEYIGDNQVEDVDGMLPDANDLEQWEKGEMKLYLCDYSFGVEKRVVSPLSLDEFKAAGIKTH